MSRQSLMNTCCKILFSLQRTFAMSCRGTIQLPCSSIHPDGLRQSRVLPRLPATKRKHLLRCQADEKDNRVAEKVPEAAQRTIDALSALLGKDENENKKPPSRPLQGTKMLLNQLYITS